MAAIVIKDARVAGVEKLVSIVVENVTIETVGDVVEPGRDGQRIDLEGTYLLPGFIDVHNHGAVGVDVNTANADDLLKVGAFLARNGVTAWMPTLVPDSDENYRRAIAAIDELMVRQTGMAVAQAVGVHYEGVFASEKMCGALRPEYFRSGQWSVAGGQWLAAQKILTTDH